MDTKSSKIYRYIGIILLLLGVFWLRFSFTLEGHIFSILCIVVGFGLVATPELVERKDKNQTENEKSGK